MRDPARRPLLGLALALGLGLGLQLVFVPPVLACRCVAPRPMAAYADDPSRVIFTGVVEPLDERGVPVMVTRRFQLGFPVAPRIWFEATGFNGQSASCGIDPLPVASEWISWPTASRAAMNWA